jgi:hypothetical protein
MRRWVCCAVVLIPACFHPNYDHVQCGIGDLCPTGLTCNTAMNLCEPPGGGGDGGNGGGSDAGSGGLGSGPGTKDAASDGANACVDRLTTPASPHLHIANMATNAGANCIEAGCHLNNSLGAGASGFQFAGTVFTQGGTTPEAGVAVQIVSNGAVKQTYTDQAGNLSFPAGTLSGNFTASALVTACPTATMMTTLLSSNGGAAANSCNLCHANGAQVPPIYLQ